MLFVSFVTVWLTGLVCGAVGWQWLLKRHADREYREQMTAAHRRGPIAGNKETPWG